MIGDPLPLWGPCLNAIYRGFGLENAKNRTVRRRDNSLRKCFCVGLMSRNLIIFIIERSTL